MKLKQRLLNFGISLDQFIYNVVTLGASAPDETISAGAYRMEKQGKWQGKIMRPFIDWLFTYIQKDHCYFAYKAEIDRKQSKFI